SARVRRRLNQGPALPRWARRLASLRALPDAGSPCRSRTNRRFRTTVGAALPEPFPAFRRDLREPHRSAPCHRPYHRGGFLPHPPDGLPPGPSGRASGTVRPGTRGLRTRFLSKTSFHAQARPRVPAATIISSDPCVKRPRRSALWSTPRWVDRTRGHGKGG